MEYSFVPGIILGGLLLVLLVAGVPIAFVLTFLGILACLVWIGSGSIVQIVQTFYGTCSSEILLCSRYSWNRLKYSWACSRDFLSNAILIR